MKAVKSTFLKF